MKYLFIVLLFLTGCSENYRREFRIDDELLPYMQQFEEESIKQNKPIKITNLVLIFDKDNEVETIFPHIGLCTKYENNQFPPMIRIRRTFWDNTPEEILKKQLVFHELGHCILNRSHDSNLRSDDFPESIMFPVNFLMYPNEEYYMRELFYGN